MSNSFLRLGAATRRVLMLMMAVLLMGLPLYALPQPPVEPAPQELSVEQILEKHYEAIGGDHHRSIESMKMTGTSVLMGMEAPYTRYAKRPNKMLLEIYVQDMTGIQAFDGETAWWYMPFMGHAAPELMPSDMAAGVVESSEFDGPLVDAAGKGHQVDLLGVEAVEGRDAYKLRVTLVTGGVQTHYVDTETFYTTRVESAAGDVVFLDYRVIEGHPVPRVIEMMGPMGEQTIYIEGVEFGVEIDDAMFRMR